MIADIKLYRRRREGSKQRQRRVRREIKQSIHFIRGKFGDRTTGEWTLRDEFHKQVALEMPSPEELEGLSSDEVIAKAIAGPLRKVFDAMAPTYEDPDPKGFKPRCQKSLEMLRLNSVAHAVISVPTEAKKAPKCTGTTRAPRKSTVT